MELSARTQLHADTTAPALARSFVTAELERWDLAFDVEVPDLILVVSELVTNAVKAGSTQVAVAMRVGSSALELIVEDDAGGTPQPEVAPPGALGGRGLWIVSELADSWTTTALPGAVGKRVTATWRGDR